jgi:uncharacterized protein YndB with AHSA1/START domain
MMSSDLEIKLEPVKKKIEVRLNQESAFRLFTDEIGKWWPLAQYSVGQELAETCCLEGKLGGRIYEVKHDGSESEWGNVTVWAPFEKVSFEWYPGRTPETAQEVTLTFTEIQGGTLVALVQTGWENLGEKAETNRDGYDKGWDFVLGQYIDATKE